MFSYHFPSASLPEQLPPHPRLVRAQTDAAVICMCRGILANHCRVVTCVSSASRRLGTALPATLHVCACVRLCSSLVSSVFHNQICAYIRVL